MGNARVGDRHLLGDSAAQANHLDVFDRRPRLEAGRSRLAGTLREEGIQILVGDAARRAGAGNLAQVDSRLSCPETDRRRGQGLLACRTGSSTNKVPQRSGLGRPVCGEAWQSSRRWNARNGIANRRCRWHRGLHSSGGWSPRRGVPGNGAFVVSRDLQADKIGTDSDHIPDLGTQPNNLALDGRGNLHRRLVGHHGSEDRIFPNKVADLDVPLDELGFRDTLADIGQLDHVLDHLTALSFRAARARRGPGRGSNPTPGHADRACPTPPHA